jgi:carboxymethylenebutenolidase
MTTTNPTGFQALPTPGNGKAVLVLHAWWGLNKTMRVFCQRLADEGYSVFAPDLYAGKVATTIAEAEELVQTLNTNDEPARKQIQDAARFLSITRASGEPLAIIGFSLGAYFALDLAATWPELVRSVTLFYGTGGGDLSASSASFLGHFAGNDPYEPNEGVDALEDTLRNLGRTVTFHHYPEVGHWFCEPDRSDAYNPIAAALAWQRTLDFLRQTF